MTILYDKKDSNVPAWKKSQQFLRDNPNVLIENGIDKTGNILNVNNFIYCKEKYASSMDFITGDGGFDFSVDFNRQEMNITQLLFGQIAYALCMQKKGGHFVLKIFDSFMSYTIDLLYLLSSFYEKVYITKPNTSRYANSEKYIVCKNFLFSSCCSFYPFLLDAFKKMVDEETLSIPEFKQMIPPQAKQKAPLFSPLSESGLFENNGGEERTRMGGIIFENNEARGGIVRVNDGASGEIICTILQKQTSLDLPKNRYIQRFLNIPISNYFLTKLEEYNSIFGQQQIENIYYTISLIETKNKNEKIDNLIRNNIHKCVSWCIKMGIPYNQIANTNIFLFHKNGEFPLYDYERKSGIIREENDKKNRDYEW